MRRRPPGPTLFPYTTLFRSGPWAGPLQGRSRGVLVADREGVAVGYALFNLQERGTMFVSPGDHKQDRKSTRLNSSHLGISYAVFCLKKKKNTKSLNARDLHR